MLTNDQYHAILPALLAGKVRCQLDLEKNPESEIVRRSLEQELGRHNTALRTLQALRDGMTEKQ